MLEQYILTNTLVSSYTMTDSEILKLISQEFDLKLLGVTEQYLEIHNPIYENGILRIDRIDRENENIIIAYLPVEYEYFFFAVYIDPASACITMIGTESRNLVSLIISSETMTSKELQRLTILQFSESWDKGEHSLSACNNSSQGFGIFS